MRNGKICKKIRGKRKAGEPLTQKMAEWVLATYERFCDFSSIPPHPDKVIRNTQIYYVIVFLRCYLCSRIRKVPWESEDRDLDKKKTLIKIYIELIYRFEFNFASALYMEHFLSIVWLPHGQRQAINEGTALICRCQSVRSFLLSCFDLNVTGSLVMRLGP